MKKKLEALIISTALWLLNKCHYNIPVIRPNIISREFSKRAMAQEKISYLQLQEWATHPIQSFEFDKHIRLKVQEAMAQRLAGDLEVFTVHTPDGLVYRCDVVYKDMSEYEKDLNLNNYEK